MSDVIRAGASLRVGDTVPFGRYRQGDGNRPKDVRPLLWQVLDVADGRALLITKQAINVKWYHKSSRRVTWERCTLRTLFLNGRFLDAAFRPAERRRILVTAVRADRNPKYDADPGTDTQDRIFLLSASEAERYFDSRTARQCCPTDYARYRGANSWGPYHESFGDCCWWWLRTPGCTNKYAMGVDLGGDIRYAGQDVRSNGNCVRPALWLRLK